MSVPTYDVAIVGAGPIGIATAVSCHRAGLTAALIDRGCLCAALYRFPRRMTFFSTAERIAIAGLPFPCTAPKPSREEALQYYRLVAESVPVDRLLYREVSAIDGRVGDFLLRTSKGTLGARRVVLATGFYDRPVPLGVPGEGLAKVSHHFVDAHPYAGMRLAIVGGANSAAIAALECWREGARVTLIHRGPALRPSVKYWLRPDLENRIAEGGITACFDTTVLEIAEDRLRLRTPDGEREIGNDFVLALTGYRTDATFLERCGVVLDERRRPLVEPTALETTGRPGIHLVGCVLGGDDTSTIFIENARHDAERLGGELARLLEG